MNLLYSIIFAEGVGRQFPDMTEEQILTVLSQGFSGARDRDHGREERPRHPRPAPSAAPAVPADPDNNVAEPYSYQVRITAVWTVLLPVTNRGESNRN